MSEIYFSGTNSRTVLDRETDAAAEVFVDLLKVFPWARLDECFAITSPIQHEVLNDQVVTTCLPISWARLAIGPECVLAARKFCMGGATSFLRLYNIYDEAKPDWLPSSAQVFFTGTNHAELMRPAPASIDAFKDLYFKGDADQIEAAFGLPIKRGQYETFYGATVVDGLPVRIKQYVYETQSGFSDWDVVWMMACKHQNKQHLLGV
jgi:hypothetical protein